VSADPLLAKTVELEGKDVSVSFENFPFEPEVFYPSVKLDGKKIVVDNREDDKLYLSIGADITEGSKLAEVLILHIGGQEYYISDISQNKKQFSVIEGEQEKDYDVGIEFDQTAGNEYQGLPLGFNLIIRASEHENSGYDSESEKEGEEEGFVASTGGVSFQTNYPEDSGDQENPGEDSEDDSTEEDSEEESKEEGVDKEVKGEKITGPQDKGAEDEGDSEAGDREGGEKSFGEDDSSAGGRVLAPGPETEVKGEKKEGTSTSEEDRESKEFEEKEDISSEKGTEEEAEKGIFSWLKDNFGLGLGLLALLILLLLIWFLYKKDRDREKNKN